MIYLRSSIVHHVAATTPGTTNVCFLQRSVALLLILLQSFSHHYKRSHLSGSYLLLPGRMSRKVSFSTVVNLLSPLEAPVKACGFLYGKGIRALTIMVTVSCILRIRNIRLDIEGLRPDGVGILNVRLTLECTITSSYSHSFGARTSRS